MPTLKTHASINRFRFILINLAFSKSLSLMASALNLAKVSYAPIQNHLRSVYTLCSICAARWRHTCPLRLVAVCFIKIIAIINVTSHFLQKLTQYGPKLVQCLLVAQLTAIDAS